MRRISLLLLAPLLILAGCSASGPGSSAGLPQVKGSFGTKPVITFPSGGPSKTLESKVLHQGSGKVVKKSDLLVADYTGQIWDGKVFDTTFGQLPAAFPIGVKAVIPGWDKTLVGLRTGTRVLLVIPPVDGYGKTGQPKAGIKPTSTLVFVVDILGVYNKTDGGDPHAKVVKHAINGVSVSGPLGGAPKVTIASGTPLPAKGSATLILRGSGPPVAGGLLVFQFAAYTWNGVLAQSSWQTGIPDNAPVDDPLQPSALDSLVGAPIGSRVLLQIPKTSKAPAYAMVIDIVAEPSVAGAK